MISLPIENDIAFAFAIASTTNVLPECFKAKILAHIDSEKGQLVILNEEIRHTQA